MSVPPVLPPEIWRHILQFVPPSTLNDLFLVNSVFYDVCLDAKYREVAFSDRVDNIERMLGTLQGNPDIARRVRSLRITALSQGKRRAPALSRTNVRQRMTQQPPGSIDFPSVRLTQAFLETAHCLKYVRVLFINWGNSGDDFSTANLWPSLAQSLEDLTIMAKSVHLEALLPLSTTTFSRMRNLTIIVQETLEHISLMFCSEDLVIYRHLHTFGHLRSISIVIDADIPSRPATAGAPGHIHSLKFLQRHADTISNLSVTGNIARDHPSAIIYSQLHLSNLQHLSLDAGFMAEHWNATQFLLEAHKGKLQSLEIAGPISEDELVLLLKILNHRSFNSESSPDCCVLSKLSIYVYRLDMPILLLLAESLGRLKVLKLRITKVSDSKSKALTCSPREFYPMYLPPDEAASEFVRAALASETLRAWKLRDVQIRRTSCCGDLVLWGLMRLLAACTPTISSFCESGSMSIPDPPNSRPGLRCSSPYECVYGKDGKA
ncbi:hypothetical protein BDN70DRAFT_403216 [Pholiota conissans]|uniref:F-box domain-containing protein n=1 Tax=Pholiota conissans TaxID=109636 RepID=A0A9P6D3Q9_9AGAR|nr:hypothetical protein BDN70DRAFT_403216 [Pholiota conissans]